MDSPGCEMNQNQPKYTAAYLMHGLLASSGHVILENFNYIGNVIIPTKRMPFLLPFYLSVLATNIVQSDSSSTKFSLERNKQFFLTLNIRKSSYMLLRNLIHVLTCIFKQSVASEKSNFNLIFDSNRREYFSNSEVLRGWIHN